MNGDNTNLKPIISKGRYLPRETTVRFDIYWTTTIMDYWIISLIHYVATEQKLVTVMDANGKLRFIIGPERIAEMSM